MTLRLAILLRITVGWLAGFAIAVAPHILPWRDDSLIPSSAVLLMAVEFALPLLLIGGTCCFIWQRSVAIFPLRWAGGTLAASWVYLCVLQIWLLSPWMGALVATAIFSGWARYRPLLPIKP